MKDIFRNQNAFTLVELMVVLVLTFVATIMIYKSYQTFFLTTETQEQVMELNQNLRIGLDTMVRELRMAGYRDADPKRRPPAESLGFQMATANTVRFTLDYTGGGDDGFDNDKDGQVDEADEADSRTFPYSDGKIGATMNDPAPNNGEDVTYALSAAADANGSFRLQRTDNTGAGVGQTLIENVDGLNFVYYDEKGDTIDTPVSAADRPKIRSVEITMVVRSSDMDPEITDTNVYRNSLSPTDPLAWSYQAPTTNNQQRYRRRLLTARVRCRNLGL